MFLSWLTELSIPRDAQPTKALPTFENPKIRKVYDVVPAQLFRICVALANSLSVSEFLFF